MTPTWTRRGLFRLAVALPAGSFIPRFKALAAPTSSKVKITMALHNAGSLVLCHANAHFGSAIRSFYRSKRVLGRASHYVEGMAETYPPEVRKSLIEVPSGPGLGLDLDWDFLRQSLADGEEFWN